MVAWRYVKLKLAPPLCVTYVIYYAYVVINLAT